MKKSIGDKIVYPAFSKYGYVEHTTPDSIQGITYKEELVLRISNDTSITAQTVIRRANRIISLLDEEREINGTMSE